MLADLGAALWAETLKARRARMPLLTWPDSRSPR